MIIKKTTQRNKQGYSKLAISLESTSSSLDRSQVQAQKQNPNDQNKKKKRHVETCEKATETTPSIQLDFDQLEAMYGDDFYGEVFGALEDADLVDCFDGGDGYSTYSEEGNILVYSHDLRKEGHKSF